MTVVQTQQVVDGDLREQAWKLYLQSFDDLRYLAVQRHVMYGDEFDGVMADARVTKFLLHGEDGSLQAMSTMATDLRSMPLISPEYFARKWPERYQAGLIYYIGFLAVDPDHHATRILRDLVLATPQTV